jgi:hypothetical protein
LILQVSPNQIRSPAIKTLKVILGKLRAGAAPHASRCPHNGITSRRAKADIVGDDGSRVPLDQNIPVRALRGVREILKAHWQRTSLFVLFVAIASALIAAVSALFAFWNYQLQLKSNEPQLASLAAAVDLRGSKHNTGSNNIELNFTDIGKRPARQGTATLFSVTETHTRRQKLGDEVPIADAANGSKILLPGHDGRAMFSFEGDEPDLILACVTYSDYKNQIHQAFIYRPKKDKSSAEIIGLDEIEQPDYGVVCN